MTFVRAWVLLFALGPIAWVWLEWRGSGRKLALALKAAALVLVIVALAEPNVKYNDTKVAVAALVDTSASVSAQDLSAASALLNRMEKDRGSNVLAVIPFALRIAVGKLTRVAAAMGHRHTATDGESQR